MLLSGIEPMVLCVSIPTTQKTCVACLITDTVDCALVMEIVYRVTTMCSTRFQLLTASVIRYGQAIIVSEASVEMEMAAVTEAHVFRLPQEVKLASVVVGTVL